MKLSRLKLLFSSLVLLGYAALGFVAFILFFSKMIDDLEVVLVLSPYTAIAGAAQALFNNLSSNSVNDPVYGFHGKELRSFFRTLSEDITNRFSQDRVGLNSGLYLIKMADFYSILGNLTKYCLNSNCPRVEECRQLVEDEFLLTATCVIGEFATEHDVRFYVKRIGDWLDDNRTFEPDSFVQPIVSIIILVVAAAYPLSGIFLLLVVAFHNHENFTPQDVGLVAGLISGLFASYWTSTIQRLSGQQ
jgi:hypothetical protein